VKAWFPGEKGSAGKFLDWRGEEKVRPKKKEAGKVRKGAVIPREAFQLVGGKIFKDGGGETELIERRQRAKKKVFYVGGRNVHRGGSGNKEKKGGNPYFGRPFYR